MTVVFRLPGLTKLADSHLLGLIEPEDIASLALYLASDESRLVTGQVLPVVAIIASIGAFVPVLFGKETVGQLETVTEAVPELA